MSQIEKAIKNLGIKRTVNLTGKSIQLACLIREEDRRPFNAVWWKGKESYLMAVDDDGNFLLRHCGGYVIYWDHSKRHEEVVAKSENEFLTMIEFGE
ncbi:hypothetical protein [Kangiella sp. M94]